MSYTTKTTIVIDHTFLNEGAKQDPKIQNILIVLNRPIGSKELFLKLLSVTNTIICSDGGANRLRKFVEKHCAKNNQILPDYIVGDMDSLTEENQFFYKDAGVQFIQMED